MEIEVVEVKNFGSNLSKTLFDGQPHLTWSHSHVKLLFFVDWINHFHDKDLSFPHFLINFEKSLAHHLDCLHFFEFYVPNFQQKLMQYLFIEIGQLLFDLSHKLTFLELILEDVDVRQMLSKIVVVDWDSLTDDVLVGHLYVLLFDLIFKAGSPLLMIH